MKRLEIDPLSLRELAEQTDIAFNAFVVFLKNYVEETGNEPTLRTIFDKAFMYGGMAAAVNEHVMDTMKTISDELKYQLEI